MPRSKEDEAIHQLLLRGELVQVNEIDPTTGQYKLWTRENAERAGLEIVPYDPTKHEPAVN